MLLNIVPPFYRLMMLPLAYDMFYMVLNFDIAHYRVKCMPAA